MSEILDARVFGLSDIEYLTHQLLDININITSDPVVATIA